MTSLNNLKNLSEMPTLPEQVNYIERDGELWFTFNDIAKGLGYSNPKKIYELYNRHRDELEEFSMTVSLAGVVPSSGTGAVPKLGTTDGKSYNTRIFSEEGLYLICMFARTEKAKEFRRRVAKFLRWYRRRQLELAIEVGKKEAREALASMSKFQREIQDKVLKYRQMGLKIKEIAKLLDVSTDTVSRTCKILRQAGWEV